MSKNVTLANLRYLARLESDFINSQYFQDSDVNLLINRSADEFYNLIIDADEDYYRTTTTINLSSANDTYAIPADFLKLKRVRAYVGSSPIIYEEVRRFNDAERVFYSTSMGQLPTLTIDFEYIPTRPDLVNDTDVIDCINGFDEYIIVNTAIKMKDREESDTSILMARKNELLENVKSQIINRDLAHPETTIDVHKEYSRWAPGNPAKFMRYRIIGQNIIFVTYVPHWF